MPGNVSIAVAIGNYPQPYDLPKRTHFFPTTPPVLPTDNPPFPGIAQNTFNIIKSTWDIPYVPAQSKPLLKSFYQAQWDIPDQPPLLSINTPVSLSRTNVVLAVWSQLDTDNTTLISNLLSTTTRGRRNLSYPTILPTTDNPPPFILPRQLFALLDIHYRDIDAKFTLPKPSHKNNSALIAPFPPPIIIVDTGLIAFQPNAFQVNYPGRTIGFQGMNRELNLADVNVVRITPLISFDVYVNGVTAMANYARGDTVVIQVNPFDPTSIPRVKFTPQNVTITIYNPDATTRIDTQPLTPVDVGVLVYRHQIAVSDQTGVYTGFISGQNYGRTARTTTLSLFTVV